MGGAWGRPGWVKGQLLKWGQDCLYPDAVHRGGFSLRNALAVSSCRVDFACLLHSSSKLNKEELSMDQSCGSNPPAPAPSALAGPASPSPATGRPCHTGSREGQAQGTHVAPGVVPAKSCSCGHHCFYYLQGACLEGILLAPMQAWGAETHQ